MEIAALAELAHGLGEVAGGAGLADLVAVEARGLARGPVGEEAFVEAARSGGAVAGEERGAQGDGETGRGGVDLFFRLEFLTAVEIERARRGADGVGRGVAGEDLLGGDVHEARAKVVGEACERGGEDDVELLGERGIGVALAWLGYGGAVDDGVGEKLERQAGDRGGIGEVECAFFREAGHGERGAADQADDVMAAARCGFGERGSDQAGGAGEKDFHDGKTTGNAGQA